MKVIFLDVDGVLTQEGWENLHLHERQIWRSLGSLDPALVLLLAEIMNRTGAKIVLSSAWRLCADDRAALGKALRNAGLRRSDVVGRTPTYGEALKRTGWTDLEGQGSYPRGMEIHVWLQDHPEVEQYVIIDDCSIVYKAGKRLKEIEYQLEHFIKTEWAKGIQREHVERAVLALGETA